MFGKTDNRPIHYDKMMEKLLKSGGIFYGDPVNQPVFKIGFWSSILFALTGIGYAVGMVALLLAFPIQEWRGIADTSDSPKCSSGSSVSKPGPSVESSNRIPFSSLK